MKIVAGNWKMHKTLNEGIELINQIIQTSVNLTDADVKLIISPPFIHLVEATRLCRTNNRIAVAAQNCSWEEEGAYTGEISAKMIGSTGAEYVIIGHSERRKYFGEDNELLKKKLSKVLDAGLKPIYCCGEELEEREGGEQFKVVSTQIKEVISDLSEKQLTDLIIAYEPVWAIGTGKTASADQAQEMHNYIRELIAELFGAGPAANVPILYGGSCKPGNAKELFSGNDVNGGLIGGASLKADDFIAIANSF